MALKFDMSRGDYRDMYGQMFPQQHAGEQWYQAGENLGTAIGEAAKYAQQNIGKYGRAYQRYLEKHKPEHVIGKDGQVTFRGPQSFQDFRREKVADRKRERIYNKIVKSDQIDAVKEHMNQMGSKIWAQENRDPNPEEIKAWVENNIDHHPEFLKSLRPGFREQFKEDVGKFVTDAGTAAGGLIAAPFVGAGAGIAAGAGAAEGLLGSVRSKLFGTGGASTYYNQAQQFKTQADDFETAINYYKEQTGANEEDFTVKNLRAQQKQAQQGYEDFNQRFEEERGLFHKGPGKGTVGDWYDKRKAKEEQAERDSLANIQGLLGNITSPFFGRKDAIKTKGRLDSLHTQLENAKSALANIDESNPLYKDYKAEVDMWQEKFDATQAKLQSQKGFFSTPGGTQGHLADWYDRRAAAEQARLNRNQQWFDNLFKRKDKKTTPTNTSNVGFRPTAHQMTYDPNNPTIDNLPRGGFALPSKYIAGKGNVNAGHTMTKRHGVGGDQVGFYHSLEPDSIYQENDPRFQFVNPLVNPNMLTDF